MKIGVIVDNEYHSDVRVKREVSLLKSFGFDISILCLSFDPSKDIKEEGVEIIALPLKRKVKNTLYFFMNILPLYEWWWKKKVADFLRGRKIDIVHTHDLYMSKCVRHGILKSGKHVPMILDLHENYPHAVLSYKWAQGFLRSLLARPKTWKKKEAKYLDFADRIIVLSDDFKQRLLAEYPFLVEKRWYVFPNVVDTDAFDRFPIKVIESKVKKPRVLYFGVIAERRGIFRTLSVIEKLLNKNVELSLVIIGPVDNKDKHQFLEEIKKPILQENLTYIPWIDLSELPSYLAFCDIALAPFEKNPQHESGIANKIFQYMYGKLPILASNCKPQKELIEEHEIGKVFNSNNEFATELEYLISNIKEREEMGKRAYEVLRTQFHQDNFKDVFLSIYEN